MKFSLLTVILLLSSIAQGQTYMEWPNLNEVKSISGRHATEEDINSGAAAFLLQAESGEYLGTPINIEIPQYAIHKDESGALTNVVIIQAEKANDQKAIGAISITDGSYMVGLYHEFELLGKAKPIQ